MSKSHRTSKSEPTIATRTLRSHPWHDVHGIVHQQMAAKPSKGQATIQFITKGVRAQNSVIELATVSDIWANKPDAWMRSALCSCDPFQVADELENSSRRAAHDKGLRLV
jgi:hypothetical protein